MSYNEGVRTYIASAAVTAYRLVKLTAATTNVPPEVEHNGDGELAIGVAQYSAAIGEEVAVKLKNHSGTIETTAAAAFATGDALYPAADGKVSGAVSGAQVATAHEAATADGDVVETLLFA